MSKILSIKQYYLENKNFGLIHVYEKGFVRNTNFYKVTAYKKKNYFLTTLDNSLQYDNIREIETKSSKEKKEITTTYLKKNGLLISYFSYNNFSLLHSLNRLLIFITKKKNFLKKLIFLKPIRAGFKCLYSGLVGFIFFKSIVFLMTKMENVFSYVQNIKKLIYLKSLSDKTKFFFLFLLSEIKLKFFINFKVKKSKFYNKKKKFYRRPKLRLLFSIKE